MLQMVLKLSGESPWDQLGRSKQHPRCVGTLRLPAQGPAGSVLRTGWQLSPGQPGFKEAALLRDVMSEDANPLGSSSRPCHLQESEALGTSEHKSGGLRAEQVVERQRKEVLTGAVTPGQADKKLTSCTGL